ncbi:hypothetical protein CEUSTIGMA_g11293.t1 [Chlamydomonas eustigma]|uniref:Uncharacterized protein n=1 Tax=Chlamydomonas eustigma TaxID=1157962 RepID=A0A250XLB0_9CHLO|nr:hypothetical protein CEUSTIGMA_g11293.t1 [Chlamydomonas eustigma]|eukprot:GAX83868.1 hypothetical protein CEUSTIGMA_g11293.t1 [Chlamydomonas eustigma]
MLSCSHSCSCTGPLPNKCTAWCCLAPIHVAALIRLFLTSALPDAVLLPFICTGPLPNKCTAEYNFNGCWRDPVLNIHACHDDLEQYRALAADGDLTESSTWASCKCPSCTTGDGVSSCNYCKGTCLPDSGTCISDQPTPQKGGSGGVGGVGVFFIVMLSITLTGGALFAAYRFALKGQMNNEIRSIMAQYMPLSSMDGPTSSHRPAAGGVFDEFDTNMRERVPLMQQPKASGLMNNGNRNQTYRPPTLDTALTTAAAESNSSGDQQHASWSTGASAGASDPLSPPGTFITVTPMATGAEPARSSMINDSNTAKQVTTTSPAPRPPAPDFMDALPPRS